MSEEKLLENATPQDRAIHTLALRLFQKMEHLDPTEDVNLEAEDWGWSELTQLQRDYYLTCVRTLLCDPRSLLIALGQPERSCSLGIHEEFLSEHGPGCTEFEKTYYLATCRHCHRSRMISKVDGKEITGPP